MSNTLTTIKGTKELQLKGFDEVRFCVIVRKKMNIVGQNCNLIATDQFFMGLALEEAAKSASLNEIPVGAVVVCNGQLIGRGRNQREELQKPMAHAEILSIEAASSYLKSWRLEQCTLYATLEPCIMCVGAILQTRISRLVFGCLDPKAGAVRSLYRLCEDTRLNHQLDVTHGILEAECAGFLTEFFTCLRKTKRAFKRAERWPSSVEGA